MVEKCHLETNHDYYNVCFISNRNLYHKLLKTYKLTAINFI